MRAIADLLDRFKRGAELIPLVIEGVSGPEANYQIAPDVWTIRQIICHLADSELVGAFRFRSVLAEDNPVLTAYDQDAWARSLDYQRRDFRQALDSFRRIRCENWELLEPLPESAFQRTGNHTERGTLTLLDLLQIYTEHAEKHAQQIRKIRFQYKQSRAHA